MEVGRLHNKKFTEMTVNIEEIKFMKKTRKSRFYGNNTRISDKNYSLFVYKIS